MGLKIWLPLDKDPNRIPTISSFNRESGITITEDTNGWYKIADTAHTNSYWGIYYDFFTSPNTTYTLTVYSKSTTGVTASVRIGSFQGNPTWPPQRDTNTTSTEKLTTYTWTTGASDRVVRVYLVILPTTTVADNYVFFKDPKVCEHPHNQGTANVTVTNNGTTYSTNGKLGGCYNFNGGSQYISFTAIENIMNTTNLSISLWLDMTHMTTTQYFLGGTSGSTGIRYSGNDNQFLIFTSSADSSYVYSFTKVNGFIHVGIIKQNNVWTVYVNGQSLGSQTLSGSININTIGRRNDGYYYRGAINDFRIYDYCLSPEEIKEIAKGLVVHFPLERRGLGNLNLFPNTDFGGVSKKYTVPSGATEGGFTFVPTEQISPDTQYTVSCRMRGSANMNLYKICTGGNEAIAWMSKNQLSTTDYKSFSITFTYPNNKTLNSLYICTRYGTSATSTGDWFEIAPNSLKLEIGNIATPWCPNTADPIYNQIGLNSTIEYDGSGFQNNGTRIGTFTWNSDTPPGGLYSVSTYAAGNSSTYLVGPILPAETKTISIWVKGDKSQSGVILGNKINDLEIGLYQSLLVTHSTSAHPLFTLNHWKNGDWNHIVVIDNNGTHEVYINGQVESTTSSSDYYIHNIDNCWLWNRSYNSNYPFTGNLSDFRAYTTILSASDVLSLYQNGAKVDTSTNPATIYGKIR